MAQIAWMLSASDKLGFSDVNMGCSKMSDQQKAADLETLARMAARLAGRDPDEHVEVRACESVFSDVAWRYPDFLARAAAAYDLLDRGTGF